MPFIFSIARMTVTTYTSCNLQIVLIKKSNDSSLDDQITIRKNLDLNEFEVTMKDMNQGDKVTHRLEGTTKDTVMKYLYHLLKNLSLDDDGYESIQVNVPLMPRVLFTGVSLKDLYVREHLQDLLNLGLDLVEDVTKVTPSVSYPQTSSLPVTATPQRSAYASSAEPPAAPRRSSRLTRQPNYQDTQETQESSTRVGEYFSHLLNNQRHEFFDNGC